MARLIPLLLALYGLPLFGAAHDFEIEKAETSYRLNPDNTAEIVYYQKQRAVTPRGRESLSRVQVAYVPEFHEVEIQFIRTLKKDGTTVEGNPASAFDANASNNPLSAYFTDSHVKVLLPPNVETGDAVEYRAVLHVRRWIKPGDFWFAHLPTTGVVKSETVVLDLPADRKIALYENPATPGKVETGSGRRIERWETSSTGEQPEATGDVAPPMFAVSSVLSWEDFGAWIRSLNRGPMQPTPEITALAARLTAGKSGEMEKIAALYSYVATKVRYIAIEFGSGRIQPHGAGEVLRNSYGDCKDQTALLSALLNAAGFKTRAVLVHPFAGVYIPEVPSIVSFSHEFTAVETKGGLVYLDSSMGPVQPQVMAPGIRGRKALVIGEDSASIVEIPEKPPVPTRFELTIKGAVSSTGGFESSVRVETSGVMELPFRRLFLDSTSADQEKALLSFGAQSAAVRQITHGDPADLTKPFWVAFEGSNPKFFPEPNATIRMDLANGAFPLQSFESTKRPTKPIPVEPFTIAIKMDLMVSGNFTVDTGMPVHRKIPAAARDHASRSVYAQ
ncbi:MAG: DUF3857 and transglutaminase domain-containing protein [Acidobacteriia bacterium]|nr:DUF3857 and transglutaminase domain-containing protein [Terriglobia bacterium]